MTSRPRPRHLSISSSADGILATGGCSTFSLYRWKIRLICPHLRSIIGCAANSSRAESKARRRRHCVGVPRRTRADLIRWPGRWKEKATLLWSRRYANECDNLSQHYDMNQTGTTTDDDDDDDGRVGLTKTTSKTVLLPLGNSWSLYKSGKIGSDGRHFDNSPMLLLRFTLQTWTETQNDLMSSIPSGSDESSLCASVPGNWSPFETRYTVNVICFFFTNKYNNFSTKRVQQDVSGVLTAILADVKAIIKIRSLVSMTMFHVRSFTGWNDAGWSLPPW